MAGRLSDRPDRDAVVGQLLRLAESDPEVDVRYKSKKILSALGALPARGAARSAPEPSRDAADDGAPGDPRLEALARRARSRDTAAIEELLAYLPTLKDPVALCAGIGAVARTGQAALVGELKRYLGHESARVVASAVEAMGLLDPDAALPLVLPVLLKDDNRVRANVLMVLYRINKVEVLAYLARMAAKFEESYRASALWCLSQLEGEDTEEILVSMLAREDSPELAEREVELLARVGTRRSVEALAQLTELQDGRRALANRTASAIRERLGIAAGEGDAAPAASPSSTGLGSRLRRMTRKVLALAGASGVMPRPASRAVPAPAADAPPRRARAGMLAAVAAAAVLGLSMRGADAPSRPAAATSPAPAASSAAPRPAPGGVLTVEGRVKSQRDRTLLLSHDYRHYAVALPAGRVAGALSPGAKVRVTGTYAGWDTLHGVVRIDGRSLEVRR